MVNITKVTGFTLVELSIIVAITGILAAIAIPSFLQADTRAQVAKAKADMAAIDLACHISFQDRDIPPLACNLNPTFDCPYIPIGIPAGTCGTKVSDRFIQLTTPIDYLPTHYENGDPFKPPGLTSGYDSYDYWSVSTWQYMFSGTHPNAHAPNFSGTVRGALWRLSSAGPDHVQTLGGPSPPASASNPGYDYDPTNGTVSMGDIVHVGPKSDDPGNCMYPDEVVPCW